MNNYSYSIDTWSQASPTKASTLEHTDSENNEKKTKQQPKKGSEEKE